jgi:hypothetical protein
VLVVTCLVCGGSGLLSDCDPRFCDGSHVACTTWDCLDCNDPALPPEPEEDE